MKDIPCRVTLDTNEFYHNLVERDPEILEQVDEAISQCSQIIEMLENNELELYPEEAKELADELHSVKEYVRGSIKE